MGAHALQSNYNVGSTANNAITKWLNQISTPATDGSTICCTVYTDQGGAQGFLQPEGQCPVAYWLNDGDCTSQETFVNAVKKCVVWNIRGPRGLCDCFLRLTGSSRTTSARLLASCSVLPSSSSSRPSWRAWLSTVVASPSRRLRLRRRYVSRCALPLCIPRVHSLPLSVLQQQQAAPQGQVGYAPPGPNPYGQPAVADNHRF